MSATCISFFPRRTSCSAAGRTSSPSHLLSQGAACKVLYLNSVDMESLTGPQAVKKAMNMTLDNDPTPPTPTIVHFKVSQLVSKALLGQLEYVGMT